MNYTIRPEEHDLQEARDVVKGAIETAKTVENKEAELQVSLGWLSSLDDDLGASNGEAFADEIFLQFNTEKEDWQEELQEAAVYGYGQSLFLEKVEWDRIEFYWQEILLEAYSLLFVEKALPETSEKLEEETEVEWQDYRENLGDEIQDFVPWSLSYRIGKKLLEDRDLEELPRLKRSDVKDAGDEVFG